MKVYILQDCKLHPNATSILGLESMDSKGVVPSEQEALDWCKAQVTKIQEAYDKEFGETIKIEEIKHANGQLFGYKLFDRLFIFQEEEMKVELFDLLYNQTVLPNTQKLGELWFQNDCKENDFHIFNFIEETLGYEICQTHPKTFLETPKQLQYAFYCWAVEQKLIGAT